MTFRIADRVIADTLTQNNELRITKIGLEKEKRFAFAVRVVTLGGSHRYMHRERGGLYTRQIDEGAFYKLLGRLIKGDLASINITHYEYSGLSNFRRVYEQGEPLLTITYDVYSKVLCIVPIVPYGQKYTASKTESFKVNLATKQLAGNIDLYKILDAFIISDKRIFDCYEEHKTPLAVYKKHATDENLKRALAFGVNIKLDKRIDESSMTANLESLATALDFYYEMFPEFVQQMKFERLTVSLVEKRQSSGLGGFYDYLNLAVIQESATDGVGFKRISKADKYTSCLVHELMHFVDYNFSASRRLSQDIQESEGHAKHAFEVYRRKSREVLRVGKHDSASITYYCSYVEMMARLIEVAFVEHEDMGVELYDYYEGYDKKTYYIFPTGVDYSNMINGVMDFASNLTKV